MYHINMNTLIKITGLKVKSRCTCCDKQNIDTINLDTGESLGTTCLATKYQFEGGDYIRPITASNVKQIARGHKYSYPLVLRLPRSR